MVPQQQQHQKRNVPLPLLIFFGVVLLVLGHAILWVPYRAEWRMETPPEGYDVHLVRTRYTLHRVYETDFYIVSLKDPSTLMYEDALLVTCGCDREALRGRVALLRHQQATGE